MKRIGTLEILKPRIYDLDAEATNDTRSTVVVEPGTYDIYSDGLTTLWMMTGKLNLRGFRRMGDGMFGMQSYDEASEIEVTFPSRRFGPDEWAELVSGTEFMEGHPNQRLRLKSLNTEKVGS
jgi:hypothetical protein